MKKIAIICFLLILPLLGKWYLDNQSYGAVNYFTKYQKEVKIVTKDELFGTESVEVKYENGFWLGLLPNDDSISPQLFVAVVPIAGILSVAGIVLLFLSRKKTN